MPTAVLTGISGFVGSAVATELLNRGYHVKGIVRFAPGSDRAQQLHASLSKGRSGSLELLEAGLLSADQEPLRQAIKGSDYVFHIASPFAITVDNPQEQLIRPAVEGTHNVLQAAALSRDTVKRVVVTSSVCAIHDCHATQPRTRGADGLYCEDDWNDVSTLEAEPYWLSKVLGEREAWRLASELQLSVSTILPNFVMGPPVCPSVAQGSLSVGFLKGAITGDASGKPLSGSWIFSDVRDVALAHVLAAELPAGAGQRFIVSADRSLSAAQVTDAIRARTGAAVAGGEPSEERRNIDASKLARELGVGCRSPEESVADMAAALVASGLVHAPTGAPAL